MSTSTRADDDWSVEKIKRLYDDWTSGGQKPKEAIAELAENSGKSEQEIRRIVIPASRSDSDLLPSFVTRLKRVDASVERLNGKMSKFLSGYEDRADADSFKAGDKVKIKKSSSNFDGQTGVVEHVDSFAVYVKIGSGSGTFKPSELERA